DIAVRATPVGTIGKAKNIAAVTKKVPPIFKGFKDLTTKILERLKGKTITSKQEILDFTNMPELKQAERDLIRNVLNDYEVKGVGKEFFTGREFNKKIPVQEFANKVKMELLPLKRGKAVFGHESVSLPPEIRGNVANYSEHVWESPIRVNLKNVPHGELTQNPNYFAHTRIEDLATGKGRIHPEEFVSNIEAEIRAIEAKPSKVRRIIELQSDLMQKGRLEQEIDTINREITSLQQQAKTGINKFAQADLQDLLKQKDGLEKLLVYRNHWHERTIREEVKQAAINGKTKLQFPTGETAMKIEGLGEQDIWYLIDEKKATSPMLRPATRRIDISDLKLGTEIGRSSSDRWIITDVLGEGKFKAVPKKAVFDKTINTQEAIKRGDYMGNLVEEFDISGKIDTNNPIYRFYEKEVGRYLKNKYGAQMITDPQGVKWWEVNIKPEMAKDPIEAFGILPFAEFGEEEKEEIK
ncbi:MAG: hypothetical protein AABY15_03860, partial [Nanoarchaeota archaeon]